MEIMEYKGVKYNKERVKRYALNSRTTPERFLDCVADNEVLQRLMRVDRDDNMRHYPLVSEGLYNKIGKELMDAGISVLKLTKRLGLRYIICSGGIK